MASPRFGFRWVLVIAAAAFFALLAALAIPFLVPIDSYRPLLVWAVESATGRDVQIDALKLSFLPTLHVTVVNFRMKNPPGFPAGDALVAGSIDLGIRPQALLSRVVDVTYITPSGVRLNVLRNAAGHTNLAITVRSNAPVRRLAPGFTLEPVGAMNVKDAEITFAEALGKELPAPAFSLRGVSCTIDSIDPQAPDWSKKVEIVADLRGTQLTLSNLNKPIEFHTGEITVKGGAARGTFSLSVGTIDLAGAAAIARLDPLSITFAVTGPELDFNKLATFLAGAHGSPTAPRRVLAHGTVAIGKVIFSPFEGSRLNGQLDVFASAVRLNAWTLSAYGGTVRGNADLNGSAGAPIAITAHARGLNVAQMLAVVRSGTGGVTGRADTDLRLTALLARDPEQSLSATGTFAVRNGAFPSIAFEGFKLPIRLQLSRWRSSHRTRTRVQQQTHGTRGRDASNGPGKLWLRSDVAVQRDRRARFSDAGEVAWRLILFSICRVVSGECSTKGRRGARECAVHVARNTR